MCNQLHGLGFGVQSVAHGLRSGATAHGWYSRTKFSRVSCRGLKPTTALSQIPIRVYPAIARMITPATESVQMSFAHTHNVLLNSNLTKGQKLVLGVIGTFTDQVGKCWPAVETIATRCAMCVRTVQHHINDLVKLHYLTRTYRTGRSAIIQLTEKAMGWLTPAKSAPLPPQNLHPEPVIEPINQTTAQTVAPTLPDLPDSPACAAVIVCETEKTELPDNLPPVPDLPPELASVPPELLEDFGLVRKAKKKSPKVTKTEARVFAAEATKAGLTVPEMLKLCILRGWSRFEASWMPTVAPTAPPQAVFKPETAQPNDPMIVSVHRAKLAELRKLIVSQKPLPGHSVLT